MCACVREGEEAEYVCERRGEERRAERENVGRSVPLLGAALQKPFREHLEAQKAKLHHHAVEGIPTEEDWMSWLFEKVGVIMVCFFVCSIVNFMAQSFASAGQGRVTAVPSTSEAPTTPFLITALPPG
ncbi:hypothetical protein JOB18_025933 [Solea senegalensis]|uniref:Uncharacterized protein n=1 Tax=Solea senegalensis TaxID=28829 RepID=A0AAV6SFC2_SOLSE|nr:hypothetical protein JOB18_025933 [Solea senegalensis]